MCGCLMHYLPPPGCPCCHHTPPRAACCPAPQPRVGRMSRLHPKNKRQTNKQNSRFYPKCPSVVPHPTCWWLYLFIWQRRWSRDPSRWKTFIPVWCSSQLWCDSFYSCVSLEHLWRERGGRSEVAVYTRIRTATTVSVRLFLSFTKQTEVVALRQPRHAVPLLVEEVEKLPWFAHHDFSHRKVNWRGRKLSTRRWAGEVALLSAAAASASDVAKQPGALPRWRLLMTLLCVYKFQTNCWLCSYYSSVLIIFSFSSRLAA